MIKILIINGPNLNLLGTREPHLYGNTTFNAYFEFLSTSYPNIELEYYQSNIEGELINKIQDSNNKFNGIIINAGAYSHTSIGILDALKSIHIPCINVHISNIYTRENFRKSDLLSDACKGAIVGMGLNSYQLALDCLLDII
jgi:3-dehydroquinate dehydratase-2